MKIGVFGSDHQLEKLILIRRLFEKLYALGAEVYIDALFYDFLKEKLHYTPANNGLLDDDNTLNIDIALSVGGDGTFLRTAARVNMQAIPILGINTGRLGFLADISSNEIDETLEEIFKNYYKVEERILLHLATENFQPEQYNYALNEVAILKRDTSSMITIHTYLNDDYLTTYQADGLVIATPTGSTAYSMSVNGPIIVPQSNSIVLTPVAPHSLNVRPLVIPDTTKIRLSVESRNDTFLVALDGRSEVFPVETELRIEKAAYSAKVVKRHNHTFYQTLREKLMWGADARMK
ncbi:NAD kinase [Parabacteroides sp. OttesenSCG-928-G07]|nr:NAD kinase [Parabacteroides sp. OttesenSCG-928-G21]MDL2277793.1 NAD kinase [Parabacteroides sp. OttesenSCG-928-G07]